MCEGRNARERHRHDPQRHHGQRRVRRRIAFDFLQVSRAHGRGVNADGHAGRDNLRIVDVLFLPGVNDGPPLSLDILLLRVRG